MSCLALDSAPRCRQQGQGWSLQVARQPTSAHWGRGGALHPGGTQPNRGPSGLPGRPPPRFAPASLCPLSLRLGAQPPARLLGRREGRLVALFGARGWGGAPRLAPFAPGGGFREGCAPRPRRPPDERRAASICRRRGSLGCSGGSTWEARDGRPPARPPAAPSGARRPRGDLTRRRAQAQRPGAPGVCVCVCRPGSPQPDARGRG